MPSCLGVYIEKNLVKYAKVRKEKENIKVESFGIKFYEKLEDVLGQIIEETNSQKSMISINIANEIYNEFSVFSLLSKADIKKSIDIEFGMFCKDNELDKNEFDSKYYMFNDRDNSEKSKVIHVATSKDGLEKIFRKFEGYRLTTANPMPISISNLIDKEKNHVSLIINIEDKTTITKVVGENVENVKTLKYGMKEILDKINESENSLSKSYEICKNTTIYTQGLPVMPEENEYIDIVMPQLNKILNDVKNIVNQSEDKIEKIYITGTGTAINNLDLFFQDYISNIECQILRPAFLETSSLKIGVKEYIEVNSAIALALDGLGDGIADLNFKPQKIFENVSKVKKDEKDTRKKKKVKKFDSKEKLMLRIIGTAAIFIVGYSVMSNSIYGKLNTKYNNAVESTKSTKTQISDITKDITRIETKISNYRSAISKMTGIPSDISESTHIEKELTKNAIPNFLNQLMFIIPNDVTLVSIKNTSGNKIQIEAKSKDYQQLGVFKALLSTEKILNNVTSTPGTKPDSYAIVTIEGELP